MMKKSTYLFFTLLFFVSSNLLAQVQTPLDIALRHIEAQTENWELTKGDLSDLVVNDQFQSKHNGVTHIYFMQRHQGIEIHNAIMNVNILPNGEILYVGDNLVRSVSEKVNTTVAAIEPETAIYAAADHLNINHFGELTLKTKTAGQYIYEGGELSNTDIITQLKYTPVFNSFGHVTHLRLTWDLAIDQKNNADYYSLRMDALTGELVDKNNYTVYCTHENHRHQRTDRCVESTDFQPVKTALEAQNMSMNVGSYNVFAIPNESPNHGDREIVTDPADVIASPFGWHDTDGMEGAEYTITRGNNVHAFLDTNSSNSSSGDEPDGGEGLIFDFPFDRNAEPEDNSESAVTQLFYMSNIIHDFTYAYGFDETSGNFQLNNYGNGGLGNDPVEANAQDGSGVNNANFSTPPDGGDGRMQMFVWNRSGLLTVDEPANLAGVYETGTADFGPNVAADNFVPVSGEVVLMNDGTAEATFGCEQTSNDYTGKVVLIDRGGCFFDEKVFGAQNAGAIAVIVCDFSGGGLGNMGSGSEAGPQVTIPSLSMSFPDCSTMRAGIGAPLVVTFGPPAQEGPNFIDGDFDNGIIAHEYGHGISNRLTGGRLNASCLTNDEQMGEGWSDFMTLIMAVKPGDVGSQKRGVGTYVQQQSIDGAGIRRFPYSNDLNVNPQTMNDIIGTTSPHNLGEVWAATLWDMYWLFVDEFGFDEDLIHGTGGNNMAVQLVFDGMKMQGCNPGFIAGRDGILAADEANSGGQNSCLIWQAFARRGFGFDALGRSANNRNDGQEGYALPPACLDELQVVKTATPVIDAGDVATFTIETINSKKETVTVTVTDEIPEGTTFIAGSDMTGSGASAGATVENGIITFTAVELAPGESLTVSYDVATPDDQASIRQFFDDVEDGDANWEFNALQGSSIWDLSDDEAFSGELSWFVDASAEDGDQVLQTARPLVVAGEQPVLRFTHQYETEWGLDGGIVEISRDNFQWERLPKERLFRAGYVTRLAYTTFAIANLDCFAGNANNGWQTTYIDLSDYQGEQIWWRYRFGTVAETDGVAADGVGWYVDDIEVMDMLNYTGMATVTSDAGDVITAMATGRGTVVNVNMATNTDDFVEDAVAVSIFPNPAGDLLNVAISNAEASDMTITMVNVDGREVLQQQLEKQYGERIIPFNIAHLASGMYFIKVTTGTEIDIKKVMID